MPILCVPVSSPASLFFWDSLQKSSKAPLAEPLIPPPAREIRRLTHELGVLRVESSIITDTNHYYFYH